MSVAALSMRPPLVLFVSRDSMDGKLDLYFRKGNTHWQNSERQKAEYSAVALHCYAQLRGHTRKDPF
jgi:hypothetical protein